MVSRFPPLVLVLGVGEISSAVAHRLFRARFRVVMTENDFDRELRRYTSFSRVFAEGRCEVEGVGARSAVVTEAASLIERDNLPVLAVDPLSAANALGPEIVVDGREHRVKTGDAFYVEAQEAHNIINDTDEATRVVFIKCPYRPDDKQAV